MPPPNNNFASIAVLAKAPIPALVKTRLIPTIGAHAAAGLQERLTERAVATAGGLVFIAAATDNLIRAIDIETGATLWQDVLPAGGQANPMVYEIGGRQYLVIMAGGHHFMGTPPGDYVIAYTLPQR